MPEKALKHGRKNKIMPKIDTNLIEGYAEMTAEQKLAALEAYEYQVDYTGYVKKDVFDKTASEAANYKKQLREKMTEQEQKEAKEKEDREAMEKELAELKQEKLISEHTASLLSLGYEKSLAESTAKAIVLGDTKTYLANQAVHQEALKKAVIAEKLKDTPKPPAGSGNSDPTKDSFKKMSLTEKAELFKKDRAKFDELSKK